MLIFKQYLNISFIFAIKNGKATASSNFEFGKRVTRTPQYIEAFFLLKYKNAI